MNFLILSLLILFGPIYNGRLTKAKHKKIKQKRNLLRKLTVSVPLKIHLDFSNIEQGFPDSLLTIPNSTQKIKDAINEAKTILESLLYIEIDEGKPIVITDMNKEEWGLDYWEGDIYKNFIYQANTFNYIIAFKFDGNINNIASAKIVQQFSVIPLIGIIIINPNLIKSKLLMPEYLKTLMLHQIIHLLGFHISIFDNVNNIEIFTSIIEEEEEDEETGEKYYYLSKVCCPKVFEYLRTYFNCPELPEDYIIKLDLDQDKNVHWPKRYFLGELMTEFDYPEEQVLSGFTLAFLEDTTNIKVVHDYTGGLFRFGKHKGCNFIDPEIKCGENVESNIYANEFYLPILNVENPPVTLPSCSSGRLSKTIHKLDLYTQDLTIGEAEYVQTFNENYYSGKKFTNYCPISEYDVESQTNIYSGRCSTSDTSSDAGLESELGETFSSSSFCVLSSMLNKDSTYNLDFRAVCYEMLCSSKSLTIKIKNNYIVCPRSGGKITAENFKGYLLCPDYNLICTGTEICNNIFDCFYNNSSEKDTTFTYEESYSIKTTQNSDVYKTNENIVTDLVWELAEDNTKTCPTYCKQCDEDKKCIKCAPNYKPDEDKKCVEIVPNCKTYEGEECTKCKTNYFLAQDIKDSPYFCKDDTPENHKYYYEDTSKTDFYKRCDNDGIEHCKECSSKADCNTCVNGYNLVKGADERITCQNIDINYYYEVAEGDKKYYIKCDKNLPNCDKCTSSNYCSECSTNHGIIEEDHERCESLLTEKYYKETSSGKYRLCNNKLTNCEKCTLDESNFSCKQCSPNYAVKHENDIQCVEKKLVKDNRLFYTNDSEINYYSCEKYSVDNCKECNNKDTCLTCKTNHVLTNESTLCIPQSHIDDKLGIYDRQLGIYTPCNAVLSDCNKCDNSKSCSECGNGAGLEESNICISKEFIENHTYILNEETHKYVSCSIINNCITCSSTTICTLCKDGFKINNNICIEATSSNDDDDKLGTGAIIGIVFGCIGFLAIVGLVAYFLLKKFIKPQEVKINSSIVINENKGDNLENPNQEENVERTEEATTKKRRIQNN